MSQFLRDAEQNRVRPDLDPTPSPTLSGLQSFANLTVGCAFLLLIAGGLVTSTGSGLSVPDWPLSFGKLMPPMIGGVLYEHGHRLIAGTVAVLAWTLAFWSFALRADRLTRVLSGLAAVLILFQAILGGITVLYRLPPPVSIAHACLAQAVFCLLLASAQSCSEWFRLTDESGSGELWRSGALAVGALFLQLVFGATLRHTGSGLLLHACWAGVAALAVWSASTRGAAVSRRVRGLWGPSALMSALVLLQIALGFYSYKARFTTIWSGGGLDKVVALTTAHLGVGALLLGASVVFLMRCLRTR